MLRTVWRRTMAIKWLLWCKHLSVWIVRMIILRGSNAGLPERILNSIGRSDLLNRGSDLSGLWTDGVSFIRILDRIVGIVGIVCTGILI